MNMTFIFLFLYLIVIGYITWQSSRSESASEYMNRTKRLSSWETTWTTFASLLTGYNFVLGVTFAYLYGFWYLTSFLGAAASFVVLYFFFKGQLTEIQSEHDLFSIGDYFGIKYGPFSKSHRERDTMCRTVFVSHFADFRKYAAFFDTARG